MASFARSLFLKMIVLVSSLLMMMVVQFAGCWSWQNFDLRAVDDCMFFFSVFDDGDKLGLTSYDIGRLGLHVA